MSTPSRNTPIPGHEHDQFGLAWGDGTSEIGIELLSSLPEWLEVVRRQRQEWKEGADDAPEGTRIMHKSLEANEALLLLRGAALISAAAGAAIGKPSDSELVKLKIHEDEARELLRSCLLAEGEG